MLTLKSMIGLETSTIENRNDDVSVLHIYFCFCQFISSNACVRSASDADNFHYFPQFSYRASYDKENVACLESDEGK